MYNMVVENNGNEIKISLSSGYEMVAKTVFTGTVSGSAMNYETYKRFYQEFYSLKNYAPTGIYPKYEGNNCYIKAIRNINGQEYETIKFCETYVGDLETYDLILPRQFETEYPNGIYIGEEQRAICNSAEVSVGYEDVEYITISKKLIDKVIDERRLTALNWSVGLSICVTEKYKEEIKDFLIDNDFFLSVLNQKGYSVILANARENRPIYLALIIISIIVCIIIIIITDALYFGYKNNKNLLELRRYNVLKKSIVLLLCIKNIILYILVLLGGGCFYTLVEKYIRSSGVLDESVEFSIPSINEWIIISLLCFFAIFSISNISILSKKRRYIK